MKAGTEYRNFLLRPPPDLLDEIYWQESDFNNSVCDVLRLILNEMSLAQYFRNGANS